MNSVCPRLETSTAPCEAGPSTYRLFCARRRCQADASFCAARGRARAAPSGQSVQVAEPLDGGHSVEKSARRSLFRVVEGDSPWVSLGGRHMPGVRGRLAESELVGILGGAVLVRRGGGDPPNLLSRSPSGLVRRSRATGLGRAGLPVRP